MPQVLCRGCNKVIRVDRVVTEDYLCAKCQFSEWRNVPLPEKPYKLSENDRIFLRVQGILPEV